MYNILLLPQYCDPLEIHGFNNIDYKRCNDYLKGTVKLPNLER